MDGRLAETRSNGRAAIVRLAQLYESDENTPHFGAVVETALPAKDIRRVLDAAVPKSTKRAATVRSVRPPLRAFAAAK